MKKTAIFLKSIYFGVLLFVSPLQAQTISTVAGCGIGDDSIATKAELVGPRALAFDKEGNFYIADAANGRVRKLNSAGIITTIAGIGLFGSGFSGDGGPATQAQFNGIYGVATDKNGNVFIADSYNNRIRKINSSGIIYTIAGGGTNGGYNGDNIQATAALLNEPEGLLVDTSGNVIFADHLNNRVRKIDTSGIITTIVGTGGVSTPGHGIGNHGPATATVLGTPYCVAMDKMGNLYVTESGYNCICKVDTGGILTILADTTGNFSTGPDGDGGAGSTATMTFPDGLAIDTSGNLYFSDAGNYRSRRINLATGIISNYAGNGYFGFSGDGGPGSAAMLSGLAGLACDITGNLYLCDGNNNRIRMVNNAGIITTFAGQSGLFDDNYTGTNAEICPSTNIATDAYGNVYIADAYNNRVRKLDIITGMVTTVAGNGVAGFSGGGGPATDASLDGPYSVAFDASGNMYIADFLNFRICMVNPSGIISTFAGSGAPGYTGDGGPASDAALGNATGVAVDATGNVYIADYSYSTIRKVSTSGIINTIAGHSTASGFGGNGGPATLAYLNLPIDVAVDGIGNIFITDGGGLRKIDTSGIIHAITDHGTGFSGDGGSSVSSLTNNPSGIKTDEIGDVFFADMYNQRIRMIDTAGVIRTVAGDGLEGFNGDGGPATAASLNYPSGLAIDNTGNMYIADGNNARIRKVELSYLWVHQTKPLISNLQVFPNPTHGKITVEVTPLPTESEQLQIYNVIGQKVYNSDLKCNRQIIDLSNLAGGIYILQVANILGQRQLIRVVKL